MNPMRLEKRVSEKNQRRFYLLDLQPTLFGEWSVIREWGRIGHPGTVRIDSFATEAEAAAELSRKAREKERRGYRDPFPEIGSDTLSLVDVSSRVSCYLQRVDKVDDIWRGSREVL